MIRFAISILLLCCFVIASALLSSAQSGHESRSPQVIRVICTNDTQAYLEPCGCGGQTKGGVTRRATLIQSLRKDNANAILVESGNLMKQLATNEACDRTLLETIAKSFEAIGYDGVGVGRLDLAYGGMYYAALKERGVAVLQVTSEQGRFSSYKVKVINKVKVGVLSFGAVPDSAAGNIDLFRARYQSYREARRECDLLVLLDQSGTATNSWIERTSKRFGAPDIVVGGADRLPRNEPEMVGQTIVVPTGSQGLFVGCVDIQIDSHGQKKMTYTRHPVTPKVEKDLKVQALVDKYYSGELDTKRVAPAKKPYFPYIGCADCHKQEYAQWQKTPHAGALVTLRKADRAVPSCLKCHSERYRTLNNLAIGQDDLQAVECASCHSDVLPHDSKPTKSKIDMKTKCLSCHNQERSPNFDYDKYIKLVSHKRR